MAASTLLLECKIYLDISDNDRDAKLTQLLKAGYNSMTDTADVLGISSAFDPTQDVQLNELVKIALFTYVAAQLETDPDRQGKLMASYESQVHALAMSTAFGDYSSISGG